MKVNCNILIFLSILVFLYSCGQSTQEQVEDHSQHSAPNDSESVDENPEVSYDCSFCGMPSDQFPKWQAQVRGNHTHMYFCSPRCMFLTVKDPEIAPKNIENIQVKDFYEIKDIDATKAFYVGSSDILGPMGPDLVPHQDEASAEEFMKDHQGGKIYSFDEVSLDVIKEITQKR